MRTVIAFAFGVLVLCGGPALAGAADAPVTVRTHDTDIALMPPEGMCPFAGKAEADNTRNQIKVDPHSDLLIAFGDCAQLSAYNDRNLRIRDFAQVKSLKSTAATTYKKSRADVLKELAPEFGAPEVTTEADNAKNRVNQANLGVKMNEVRTLGVVDSDDRALYVGILIGYDNQGALRSQTCVIAVTVLRQKLIAISFYTDNSGLQEINGTIARARKYIDRMIALN